MRATLSKGEHPSAAPRVGPVVVVGAQGRVVRVHDRHGRQWRSGPRGALVRAVTRRGPEPELVLKGGLRRRRFGGRGDRGPVGVHALHFGQVIGPCPALIASTLRRTSGRSG